MADEAEMVGFDSIALLPASHADRVCKAAEVGQGVGVRRWFRYGNEEAWLGRVKRGCPDGSEEGGCREGWEGWSNPKKVLAVREPETPKG